MEEATWLVSDENDEAAFARLGEALRNSGYVLGRKSWGVGGSQELSEWRLWRGDQSLHIVAETYMGLTVSGPSDLVANLQQQYGGVDAR